MLALESTQEEEEEAGQSQELPVDRLGVFARQTCLLGGFVCQHGGGDSALARKCLVGLAFNFLAELLYTRVSLFL